MSTLNVTNISDGTNSTSTTNVVKGSAKAWVNFGGVGTIAIRDQYNVSSLVDNGTGQYTVNFTNAMSDTNYAWACSARDQNNGMGVPTSQVDPTRSVTTTAISMIYNYSVNQGFYDAETMTLIIFGD